MAKHNEKGSLFLLAALAAVIVVLAPQVKLVVAGTVYTDAMKNCVKGVVENSTNIKDAPGLVRLLFHDAFVRATEQGSPSNGGLRGLNLIDDIREACFKDKVLGFNASCADGIAFAAHAATYALSNGKIDYTIDGAGRKDGVESHSDEPGKNLPRPTFNYTQLVDSFKVKGFKDAAELVALSGAHCIGVAHPTSFTDRNPANGQISATYSASVKLETTPNGVKNNVRDFSDANRKVAMYVPNGVNMTAVGALDNSYYNANLQNMVPFTSDWALRNDTTAAGLLIKYRDELDTWMNAFKAAMTKLSNDLPAEGTVFEKGYRNKCSATNFNTMEDYTKKN